MLKNVTKWVVCAALAVACAVPASADPLTEQKKAQTKLLAYRAARADAIRKLAERIKGLHITSETTVKDFVTESDKIQTAMVAYLSGMKESSAPKYMEDGTCEVTMEVTLVDVITTLETIHKAVYKGDKFKVQDFEKMTQTNEIKVIKETGTGAPRPESDTAVPVTGDRPLDSLENLTGKAKQYWLANVMPQGRLMAVRAARVDAMRRLAERIKGVQIASNTTVKDFVAQSDDVNVRMETFLLGARENSITYHDEELIVDVEMQVKLRTVYANLKQWGETHFKGDRGVIKQMEELTVTSEDIIVKETGSGVPPEKYLRGQAQMSPMATMVAQNKLPDWISQTLRANGNAAIDIHNENKAQAKLMAFRAAELDARRKLAEQLDGLQITSNTSVRDFVAQNDDIRTAMLSFQQGAHVVDGSQKLMEDGTAQVVVEIELRPLWDSIMFYQKKLSISIK